MPFYRKPRGFTPLPILAEKKSIKNGVHHAIFTSRLDRYVGDWKKDLKEGKVSCFGALLRVYDAPGPGKGYFLTIGGKLYEGDWYKGFRHGFGILSHRLENGTFQLEYRGEWVRGKFEGVGWRYYENGDVYFGFFKQGHKQGYGKMWYANGTFYVGYWNEAKKNGLGMFILQNGDRYEGNWENDLKNGLGRFYHMHTGQLQEGCWKHNICIKSKMSDIIIRQFCDMPTPYPIPPQELKNAKKILENSELWLRQKLGDIDKHLKYCIDQMY